RPVERAAGRPRRALRPCRTGEAEIAGHALGTRSALVSLSALRPLRTGASLRPLRWDLAPRQRALVVPALPGGRVDDAQRAGRLHVAARGHAAAGDRRGGAAAAAGQPGE